MKVLAPLGLVLFAATSFAQAVDPDKLRQQSQSTPINTFRFIGNNLICKTQDPDDDHSCSRIGEFKVGDRFDKVAQRLGAPWRVDPRPGGSRVAVHIIHSTPAEQAYWVIEDRDGKIASIQLTGNVAIESANFSTIGLTDPASKVREILGPRYSTREVPEIHGQLWDYAPFAITIEFVEGRVYSIRVAE